MISALSLRTLATSAVVIAFVAGSSSPASAAVANRSLGKPATSMLSSQCTAGSGPANAVDGARTDIYNTRNFSIRASADGIYWITVAVVNGNTASTTFSPVNTGMPGGRTYYARYVELVVTQATQTPATPLTTQVTRIYEFEAYGSDTCEASCI